LVDLSFLADLAADARELIGYFLVHFHDIVEGLRDLSVNPDLIDRQAN
jgi:hypothetical protein